MGDVDKPQRKLRVYLSLLSSRSYLGSKHFPFKEGPPKNTEMA